MIKKYQINEFDTSALAVPEQVSVALGEIAADMREGLLALAVGAGLQVMAQLMEADVIAACGPRGRHDPDRAATRHGTEQGSVTLGGRRLPIARPRVRAVEGSGEVPVPAYELFSSTELLGRMAMERMLAAVSNDKDRGPQPGVAGTADTRSCRARAGVPNLMSPTTFWPSHSQRPMEGSKPGPFGVRSHGRCGRANTIGRVVRKPTQESPPV